MPGSSNPMGSTGVGTNDYNLTSMQIRPDRITNGGFNNIPSSLDPHPADHATIRTTYETTYVSGGNNFSVYKY